MQKKRGDGNQAKRHWLQTGVYNVHPHKLTDTQRDDILLAAQARRHWAREAFIEAIEVALGAYHAGREFFRRTTPALVRKRILDLREGADKVSKLIDRLNGHSRWLLYKAGRGPEWAVPGLKETSGHLWVGIGPDGETLEEFRGGFTFGEAAVAIHQIKWLADTVLTEEYPRGRIEDWPKKNLACRVALALREHLGTDLATNSGRVEEVLRSVFSCTDDSPRRGTDNDARDLRGLVTHALTTVCSDE